jgi:hypothetical protein
MSSPWPPIWALRQASSSDEETTRLTRGLAAWVLTQIAVVSDEDAAASVTDGFDDNGIDAVFVDSDNSVVYLVQSKTFSVPLRYPAVALVAVHGHAKVTTTLAIYTHLFDDDHAETMAALEAMSRPMDSANVVRLRRRG